MMIRAFFELTGALDIEREGMVASVEIDGVSKNFGALAAVSELSLSAPEGDVWRMDFSRFNQYKEAPPAKDSGGWVWSRHGVWDSHIPECFPYIRFTTRDVSQAAAGRPVTPISSATIKP